MSTPPPPTPTPPPPAPTPAPAPSASTLPTEPPVRPADVPLTGFRSALSYTGIPRSVLQWTPRLPSRNWSVFLLLVGSASYAYYYDRSEARRIRKEYEEKVAHYAQEPLAHSLDEVRKVKVVGARWPEDDDDDRASRYFRKYVKPYLVAAGIDYETVPSPLLGSISRQTRASVLSARRAALGLEAPDIRSVPAALAAMSGGPLAGAPAEAETGVVVVGRPSLKEYLDGLGKGWRGGVDEWVWEQEVERALQGDGVFETTPVDMAPPVVAPEPASTPPAPTSSFGGLFSRPSPPSNPTPSAAPPSIPAHLHAPPSPLPPHPPLLLLPFTNHLGFLQIPHMVADFFTERRRILAGARAALALIDSDVRPMRAADTEFELVAEKYYKKSFAQLPERIEAARKEYYAALGPRIDAARRFKQGERDMTDAERTAGKVVTEQELRDERLKKELRWTGMLEGYEIVRPETPVVWDDKWASWLRVYDVKDD
ncbi:mitochondrial import inner membrane translocase subunit tim54 [Cryptotrichosporon argae]